MQQNKETFWEVKLSSLFLPCFPKRHRSLAIALSVTTWSQRWGASGRTCWDTLAFAPILQLFHLHSFPVHNMFWTHDQIRMKEFTCFNVVTVTIVGVKPWGLGTVLLWATQPSILLNYNPSLVGSTWLGWLKVSLGTAIWATITML